MSNVARSIHRWIAVTLMWALAATALAADPAVTSMDRFFDGLQTLSADFEQTLYDAKGSLTQTAQGRLSIQRPGRFRWDYSSPYRQLVLGDGQRLWTYDADLEQATVKPQEDALAGLEVQVRGPEGEGRNDARSGAPGTRRDGSDPVSVKDCPPKRTFTRILFLFTLRDTGDTHALPVIAIPAP